MPLPDYCICVPSRKRADLMKHLRSLLPDAIICVDEAEAEDYRKVVPAEKLMFHPGVKPISAIRQWILDNRQERCVVMCDDDLIRVMSLTRLKRRVYDDPADIRAIVENTITCADDLGLSLFCWAATGRFWTYEPHRPISLVAPAMGTFGVIGRGLRLDCKLERGEDVDLSLQALLKDRILYQDTRFKFDCGGMFRGKGGCQGVRSQRKYEEDTRALKHRWGQYVSLSGRSNMDRNSRANVERVSIAVPRRSPMASHR